MTALQLGRMLCVGIRGAHPGDETLERDLDACAEAGVGGVVLFDLDVPRYRQFLAEGVDEESARTRATRNILDPEQLRALISHLRERLGDDVFVGVDQEGGQVARLSSRRGFAAEPSAAEFARLGEDQQREAARAQASQLRELGFDLNFAPCVDLAIEPESEIIVGKERSFGSDPRELVEFARVVLDAHEEAGIVACLKHFPGHGSSRDDTHLGIVDISSTWNREEELHPYRILAERPGVAVMVGHLLHEGIDSENPASLSKEFISGLLRTELGFEGVVITDSIDMRAIRDRFSPEEATLTAIISGADLVVDAFNLDPREEHPAPALSRALRRALDEGTLAGGEERIRRSLRRLDQLREGVG